MSVCPEFTQNAWRKELCANCQRPRGEHSTPVDLACTSKTSPKPTKRTSVILKSSVSSSVENGQADLANGNKSKQGLNILNNNSSNKQKLKSALSNSNRKNKSGKVVFDTSKSKVIGCDGGLDNLFDDDDDNNDDDSSDSKPDFTFTNDEKKFAMLALENTLWNAEVTNLQINSDKKRYKTAECREFEDVHVDLLSYFEPTRFSNLKDCDAIPVNSVNYGTFPVRKKIVDSKVKLSDYFSSQCKMSNDIEFNRIADTIENADSESSGSEHYRHLPSSVIRVKSLTPSTNSSLSSDSDKSFNSDSSSKQTPGIDEIAVPYKIVSVITKKYSFSETKDCKDKSESYTMDDITECLYGTGKVNSTHEKPANVMIKSFSEDRPVKKPAPNPKILKKSVSETPKHEEMDSASLEAVEMLNDVLACYSEGEELHNHGFISKKDKTKKSAFENNLATVAASLDLQKTKSKRPAPRPPSSPPPEPQVSPTRKLANKDEIEPVFKMVPLGKSMVSPPPQPESPIPVSKSRNDSSSSLEEHLLNDNGDMSRSFTKSAENGKSKRGITSFFRNVFRRGKESPETIEPLNPDITLVKAESRSDNSTPSAEIDQKQEESKASPSMKRSSKFSPQPKFRVLPPSSSQDNQTDSATASPSPSRKNDITSSPKLKRDRVTFSPPSQHKSFSNQEPDELKELKTESSKPVAPPKPEISAKPTAKSGEDVVIRRRSKSPKRTAPPIPPPKRTSIPNKTSNANNPDFAKELERRLSRPVDLNTIIEARRSITDKMGPPPSPPPKTCASPVEEERESESPSPPEFQEESKSNDDILPVEKIELPTSDRQGRKSFLGKLSKPKQRAPQPPSVKRAKSINDSTLPRIEKKNKGKKINVADISGPVMVTDVVNNKVLENRRNTISLGDEPAFTTAVILESDYNMDNSFEDLPVISPLGSLENLYESILPKFGGRPHWYDPVKEDKTIKKPIASIPAEGYLEPVATQNLMITNASISTQNVSLPSTESLTAGISFSNIMTTSMIVDHPFPPNLNNSGMSTSFCASSTLPRASKKTKKLNTNTLNKTIGGSIINIPPPPPPPVKEKKPVSNDVTTGDEDRRLLLASQPIYEEINGYYKLEEEDTKSVLSQVSQLTNVPETDTLTVTDNTTRSQSKETLSSESDTQSTCSTLSRPRPIPRRRPKRPDTGGSDQYVSMNRSNVAVTLGEERLRDVYSKLTSINLKALQDIYSQTEAILSTEKLTLLNPQMLKWVDFDVYGQPLHSSERCIVYNAKYKANNSPCQLMLLHSRPATEMSSTCHPSLLKPVAVFADTIPFINLSEEFIKTSQVAQNSIYDTNLAKCFIAVGSFDIIETLDSHIALLKETLSHNLDALMHIILTLALQLLSAMSHCLDQGYTVTERDFRDVFLLTRSDLRGKIIAFLPHQRSHDAHQGEAMCTFIDKLFKDVTANYLEFEEENETLLTIENMRLMLEPKRVDCLAQVRSVVEYLLWGPNKSDLLNDDNDSENSIEQELSIWLEKERAVGVARFAKNISGICNGISLDDYYRLKFLLKSSAVGLAESTRRLP